MAKLLKTLNPLRFWFSIAIITLLVSVAIAKSQKAITDAEVRSKKNACYSDIESGMWGSRCKSSVIAKENCALRCLSPECYELIYGSDPLEEGEKDYTRSQEYKYCMYSLSIGESIDGIKGSFDR
ncbi:hypothetical protein Scep_027130 [Stephania cephalantha]|uniref:Uncharacterized protein n=1 Tax=Stephania cephalantha TaxID=152367 RepID=A0AAP0ELG7_9MAGN